MKLEEGQIWEFVNSTVNSDGAISSYRLEGFDHEGRYGSAWLINEETEEIANITSAWLKGRGPSAPFGHWRLKE